jgi:hypothetical protein
MLPRFLSLAVLILAIQPALDACTTFCVRAGDRVLNQLHSHRNAGSHDEAFGRTRVFHRYASEEMSGPLPPFLFKIR